MLPATDDDEEEEDEEEGVEVETVEVEAEEEEEEEEDEEEEEMEVEEDFLCAGATFFCAITNKWWKVTKVNKRWPKIEVWPSLSRLDLPNSHACTRPRRTPMGTTTPG
jgi:hypothetical protein